MHYKFTTRRKIILGAVTSILLLGFYFLDDLVNHPQKVWCVRVNNEDIQKDFHVKTNEDVEAKPLISSTEASQAVSDKNCSPL
jgi:hypothetical protein